MTLQLFNRTQNQASNISGCRLSCVEKCPVPTCHVSPGSRVCSSPLPECRVWSELFASWRLGDCDTISCILPPQCQDNYLEQRHLLIRAKYKYSVNIWICILLCCRWVHIHRATSSVQVNGVPCAPLLTLLLNNYEFTAQLRPQTVNTNWKVAARTICLMFMVDSL